jgi:hypothetical protein
MRGRLPKSTTTAFGLFENSTMPEDETDPADDAEDSKESGCTQPADLFRARQEDLGDSE